MWINYQFMAVCPLILNFLHISSQKWLVFANYFGLPNFLPQLPNFFTRIYPLYPWHFPTLLLGIQCNTTQYHAITSNLKIWHLSVGCALCCKVISSHKNRLIATASQTLDCGNRDVGTDQRTEECNRIFLICMQAINVIGINNHIYWLHWALIAISRNVRLIANTRLPDAAGSLKHVIKIVRQIVLVLVFTIWPITMNNHVLYSQPKMWLSKHITRCWLQATSSAFRLHLISRKIWMKCDYRLLRAIQSFSDRLPTSDRNPFSRAAGSSFAMISRAGAVQAAMENWSRRVNTAAKLRWCRQWCICVSGSFIYVCTWTYTTYCTTYSCKSAASWGSTLNN